MPHANNFYDLHDKLILAHAVFASITALFLIPASVIVARYMRSRPYWFRIHWILNIVSTLFITMTFILGVKSINGNQIGGSKSDTHHRFGLVAFFLIVSQSFLGLISHFTRAGGPPAGLPAKGKSWVRYFHVFTGICVAGTVYAAVYSGFHEWTKASDTGTATPLAVRIVYWFIFAIGVGAYLSGFWWMRNKKGKAVSDNAAAEASEESVSGDEKDKEAIASA